MWPPPKKIANLPPDPPTWMLRYSPNTSRYLKTQCVHPLVTRLTWHILVAKIPHLCCWKRSIFTDFLAQETRFDWIIVPYFLFHVIHDFCMFNPCVGGSRWSVWGRASSPASLLTESGASSSSSPEPLCLPSDPSCWCGVNVGSKAPPFYPVRKILSANAMTIVRHNPSRRLKSTQVIWSPLNAFAAVRPVSSPHQGRVIRCGR